METIAENLKQFGSFMSGQSERIVTLVYLIITMVFLNIWMN